MYRKIKINPSRLKLSARCDYAAALRYMVDPDTDEPYKAFFNSASKGNMHQGIYFEECLTGNEHVARPNEIDTYGVWKKRSSAKTKNRIESFAAHCEKFIDYDTPFETNVRLEVELPDLILYGILDFRGGVRDHDGNVSNRVVDFKYTADISYVWDFGQGSTVEQYLQVPLYCMMDALQKSIDVGTIDMFYDAIAMTHEGNIEDANQHVEEWAESIKDVGGVLSGAYLICESKDVPVFVNKKGQKVYKSPEVRLQLMEVDPKDFLYIYFKFLLEKEIIWGDYALSRNKYSSKISREVNPNQFKCLGVGRLVETKGRCPLIHSCPYGSRFLSGTHIANVSDIIRS